MIEKTYKTEIYPSEMQQHHLRMWGNALRGVWNACVADNREAYKKYLDTWCGSSYIGWKPKSGKDAPKNIVEASVPSSDVSVGDCSELCRGVKKRAKLDKKIETCSFDVMPATLVRPSYPERNLYKFTNRSGQDWMQEIPGSSRSVKSRSYDKTWELFFTGKKGMPTFQKKDGRIGVSFQNINFVCPVCFFLKKVQKESCASCGGSCSSDDHIVIPGLLSWDKETKRAFKKPVRLAEPLAARMQAGKPQKKGKDAGWGNTGVATITFHGGKWHISFPLVGHHQPAPRDEQLAKRGIEKIDYIGVDVNCGAFVCSDGRRYDVPEELKRLEVGVREARRKLSRCTRGSKRYYKVKDYLAKRAAKQARVRKDWLDKITYDLTTRCTNIVIEDINVRGMTKSAKGTVENPGKNVRAKAGLSRSILNASFGKFRLILEQKAGWYGSSVHKVNPKFTSQDCSAGCGNRQKMPLSVDGRPNRVYVCNKCGNTIDRDLNAAINIKNKFLRQ